MSTRNQIDAEAQKDPDELEREIDQTRTEIGNIVHALENKLSPGELIDTALGYVKGGGGEFFGNLSNTVKANPVPTSFQCDHDGLQLGVGRSFHGRQASRQNCWYEATRRQHEGKGQPDES